MHGDLRHLVCIDHLVCILLYGINFFTGYAPCLELTGPDFQSVFNLNLWAANAKLISYYMVYGLVHSHRRYDPRLIVFAVEHRGVLFLSTASTVSMHAHASDSQSLTILVYNISIVRLRSTHSRKQGSHHQIRRAQTSRSILAKLA